MTRIVQIISVLTLSAAGLILARGIAALRYDDPQVPPVPALTAVERFRQSCREQKDDHEQVPPLVQQAQALALYLNPPPAPVTPAPAPGPTSQATAPLEARPSKTMAQAPPIKPPASSPKFELHGISYYRQKPDQSMALVLEPGGSRHWVHPGEQVGHLTIERIDSNSVVCRDQAQTYTLALAPDETVTKYARSLKNTKPAPAPQQAQNRSRGPEVPPPAPGIRQMPLSRVAAMQGRPS
jgi:hypothetical protein